MHDLALRLNLQKMIKAAKPNVVQVSDTTMYNKELLRMTQKDFNRLYKKLPDAFKKGHVFCYAHSYCRGIIVHAMPFVNRQGQRETIAVLDKKYLWRLYMQQITNRAGLGNWFYTLRHY